MVTTTNQQSPSMKMSTDLIEREREVIKIEAGIETDHRIGGVVEEEAALTIETGKVAPVGTMIDGQALAGGTVIADGALVGGVARWTTAREIRIGGGGG